jgi:hypothetical protein
MLKESRVRFEPPEARPAQYRVRDVLLAQEVGDRAGVVLGGRTEILAIALDEADDPAAGERGGQP